MTKMILNKYIQHYIILEKLSKMLLISFHGRKFRFNWEYAYIEMSSTRIR